MATKVEVSFSDKKFHILVQEENGMEQKINCDGTAARHLYDRLGERLDGPTSKPAAPAAETPAAPAPASSGTETGTVDPTQPEVEKE